LNTTELIRHWTMEGAAPDVGDRFRSMAGVPGVAGDTHEPPAGPRDALRMRPSDEEEWRPLLLAAGDK
jgi:hypothetical protein